MDDSVVILLADIFNKKVSENTDGFIIIQSSVAVKVLSTLYEKLIKSDIPPIETLTKEEKFKYYNIARRYYQDEVLVVKASKASYMISIITNSN